MSCQVQPSHIEHVISVVCCKKERMLLQHLRWHCIDCVIHHKRDMGEEQHHIYVARTSNNRVIAAHDLYCCLLPQCEALHTCHSGFPIATTHSGWHICTSRGTCTLDWEPLLYTIMHNHKPRTQNS